MTKEGLMLFCNLKREKMDKPFSVGDYTYATNGHILVRVRRLDDVPEGGMANSAAGMFDGLNYDELTSRLVKIPSLPKRDVLSCHVCDGSGKVSNCPECDGNGEVVFSNSYNEYECDCLTCFGYGTVSGEDRICEECKGTGKQEDHTFFKIGDVGFSSHYLAMVKCLPGALIAPTAVDKANYFKWDDGDGLLMPMLNRG